MRLIAVSLIALASTPALGAVTSIGPFTGAASEGFESFTTGPIAGGVPGTSGPVPVLGGFGSLSGQHVTTQTPIYVWSSDGGLSLGTNGVAVPFDGLKGIVMMPGQGSTISTGRFDFPIPVDDFGGYWVHAKSGALGASTQLRFYDASNNLIHTQNWTYNAALGGVSQWLGWHSDTPIGAVEFTGYYMGVDGVQINIPAPATALLLSFTAPAALGRRR